MEMTINSSLCVQPKRIEAVGDPRMIVSHTNSILERIIAIEYHRYKRRWGPFAVVTQETRFVGDKSWHKAEEPLFSKSYQYYDFDFSRSTGNIYYHMSGAGGSGFNAGRFCEPDKLPARLWMADGFHAKGTIHIGNNRDLKDINLTAIGLRNRGYLLILEPLNISHFGWRRRSEFNPFDVASESDVVYCTSCRSYIPTDSLCDHIVWCELCEWWVNQVTGKSTDSVSACTHSEKQRYEGEEIE